MRAGTLLTIAVVATCFCDGAIAGERLRHPQRSVTSTRATKASKPVPVATRSPVRSPAVQRDAYVDPAAPYKANRLSSFRGQSPLDVPGQTTVLTRDVLDDMNATSLKDALRSTAGVTVR